VSIYGASLGFNCPLCREYVPCPGDFNKPDEWAGLFPVNDVLEAIVQKPEEKLCDPCLRDSENENATAYCFSCAEYLCTICTKHHRKHLPSKNHTVHEMNKMTPDNLFPAAGTIPNCAEHKNKRIKFFCGDHQLPCCSLCIGTKHRKCETINTVEEAAKHIKENGELNVLLGDVKIFETKLTQAKNKQEKNLAQIENSIDEITAQTEKEFKELVCHLEKLKNRHLDEMAGGLKKGREKLKDCTNVLADGIQCANYCSRNIEKNEANNDAEIVMTYHRVKARLMQLKKFKFISKEIMISEVKSQFVKELMNMESFGNVEYSESDCHVMYDVHDITLSLELDSEFITGEEDSYAHTGNFLSNGNFAVTKYASCGSCLVYSKDWQPTKVIDGLSYPFEVIQAGDELLITCKESKLIEVFSVHDFHKLRSIKMNSEVWGITNCNGVCYIACRNKITKIDMYGSILREYKTGGSSINISATKDGHLVYSSYSHNTVTAITDQGDRVWLYTHPSMKYPRGIDVDSVGNIFVACRQSNNIHILSKDGALIRIMEDVPQPVFIKLMEDKSKCCVCSNFRFMKVYKL
jgi:hypothetical protein